jgi:hypothetical protein
LSPLTIKRRDPRRIAAKRGDRHDDIQEGQHVSRRRFLKVAAAGAAATVAAPSIASAQGPVSMRWQSMAGQDIFHEYALDYAEGQRHDRRRSQIEVLPAGAVVPAFGLLDAVSRGLWTAATACWFTYGKQNALALWGSGPGYAMDANMLLPGTNAAAARAAACCTPRSAPMSSRSRLARCRPTRSAGSEAGHQGRGSSGRQVQDGRHLDRRVHRPGCCRQRIARRQLVSAMDRGLPTPPSSTTHRRSHPRLPRRFKICMLQSYHQNAEQFEIMFNKDRRFLPEK